MYSLEFKNDGISDSLTGVPSPALFLENAAREFASARRDLRPLSILSLRYLNLPQCPQPPQPYSSHVTEAERESIQLTELTNLTELTEFDLVALARSIQKVLRKGEFFTRISESGFWIAIRGDTKASEILSERIRSTFDQEKNQWRASTIECTPLITFDQWIESADRIHFDSE